MEVLAGLPSVGRPWAGSRLPRPGAASPEVAKGKKGIDETTSRLVHNKRHQNMAGLFDLTKSNFSYYTVETLPILRLSGGVGKRLLTRLDRFQPPSRW
jgi:hypothetical protein